MSRANFYGQSTFTPYYRPNLWLSSAPTVSVALVNQNAPKDSFDSYLRFEQKLHNKFSEIEIFRHNLKQKLSDAEKNGKITPELKESINDSYALLERNEKLLSFFVDQLQKSSQAISSNFR
jgi:hypothetical protein